MSKKLMIVWFLVMFMMCATLIFIHYNSLDKDLLEIEKTVKTASKEYFKDYQLLPKLNESAIVKVDDLIEKEYLKEDKQIEKYCIQGVKVVNKLFIPIYEVEKECKEVIKESEAKQNK